MKRLLRHARGFIARVVSQSGLDCALTQADIVCGAGKDGKRTGNLCQVLTGAHLKQSMKKVR